MKKTLSIILPNYNYSKFLKTSLSAMLNQTRKPDKLIIIDDGSTDNSLQVIEELTKDIPYVFLLKNTTNKGIVYSVNKALSTVSTDYTGFIAADDILANNYISEMMKFIEEHSDISLCCSLPAFFTNSKKIWYDDFNVNEKKIFQPDELVKQMGRMKFYIATHSSIIKTYELKNEPSYDILKYYVDWFWLLNIAFKKKIGFIPKPLAFMRIHESSYSAKKDKYKDAKKMYSFLMDKINNEDDLLKKRFLKSKVLACLDKNLIIFLIFRIKYREYLPGIFYGKTLKFFN